MYCYSTAKVSLKGNSKTHQKTQLSLVLAQFMICKKASLTTFFLISFTDKQTTLLPATFETATHSSFAL